MDSKTAEIITQHSEKGLESDYPKFVCRKCGRELPSTEFYPRKGAKTGFSGICKQCHKESIKESKDNKKRLLNIAENGGKKLSDYSPRELMQELARRGYKGKLTYLQEIDITDF